MGFSDKVETIGSNLKTDTMNVIELLLAIMVIGSVLAIIIGLIIWVSSFNGFSAKKEKLGIVLTGIGMAFLYPIRIGMIVFLSLFAGGHTLFSLIRTGFMILLILFTFFLLPSISHHNFADKLMTDVTSHPGLKRRTFSANRMILILMIPLVILSIVIFILTGK